jgi:hypothetical protein
VSFRDENLILQDLTTKTATFQTDGKDLKQTGLLQPMWMHCRYKDAAVGSGTGTLKFSWEDSDDNAAFFAGHSANNPMEFVNLTTTAKSGIVSMPLTSPRRYVRGVGTFTGTNPTAGVEVFITNAKAH